MPSREGCERERWRPPPEDLRSRDRCDRHRLDLDVDASLINVDLDEHVADAQGRALVMGDDDLHLLRGHDPHRLHVGHHGGRTIDVVGWIGLYVRDRGDRPRADNLGAVSLMGRPGRGESQIRDRARPEARLRR